MRRFYLVLTLAFFSSFALLGGGLFAQVEGGEIVSPSKKSQKSKKSLSEKEVSLFEIDRLIRKTEYDQALAALNDYIVKHPDNFDAAQSRIKRIMNARLQYSILAEQLIDLIQTDPENNQKIYEITAKLESFERHPSDQNLKFIADLKKSAEFNYFRALFQDFQVESAQLTGDKKYAQAVSRLQEGFWLYKDDFYQKWEDNPEITEKADGLSAELTAILATFTEKNFLPRNAKTVEDFVASVNKDDFSGAQARFSDVQKSYESLNQVRTGIYQSAMKFQALFEDLKKIDLDSTDASYLPFMYYFIFGLESIENSGLLGAVDALWNDWEDQMNQAIFAALGRKWSESDSVFALVSLENQVLDLYKTVEELENPYTDNYIYAAYVSDLAKNNDAAQALIKRISDVAVTSSKDETILTTALTYAMQIANDTGPRENRELESASWSKIYRLFESPKYEWPELSYLYQQSVEKLYVWAESLFKNVWTNYTEYYKAQTLTQSEEIQNALVVTENLRKGFAVKVSDSEIAAFKADISMALAYKPSETADSDLDFGINYAYPDFAVSLADDLNGRIDIAVGRIDQYKQVISDNFGKAEIWKLNDSVVGIVQNAQKSLSDERERLLAMKATLEKSKNDSRSQIIAAQVARNEADLRYSEAESALARDDFDLARKKLENALAKYDEALNNQEDGELRSSVDIKLGGLGERIVKAENELVVRQVRQLVNNAQDAITNSRFDDAEKYLNQAKLRWQVTNSLENMEITDMLAYVNTALSMKTGREILPSDPQYPEMSQLLDIAYKYFNEGSRLLGQGDKVGAASNFDLALESIRKLQYVYPLNQEAALLTLRINKLQNPQKFRDEFAQKISAARVLCENRNTRQEGYSNLLDYAEIEPDYPGLKQLIYDVEIQIGVRQRPVDNSQEKRALNLISQAQRLYNRGGGENLQKALDLINQALTVLPDNKNAAGLKDSITIEIGGNATTVLSTEDERLYQLAIQRLQNNNVVGANAIVEQLLKKKSNANSQKIKDLKNKIDARS